MNGTYAHAAPARPERSGCISIVDQLCGENALGRLHCAMLRNKGDFHFYSERTMTLD